MRIIERLRICIQDYWADQVRYCTVWAVDATVGIPKRERSSRSAASIPLCNSCLRIFGSVFDQAKRILEEAGVPPESLETQFGISVSQGDVVTDLLDEARENDFGTIVAGRRSFSALRELFEHHLADELVRHGQGLTIWVVE